jgi:DHA1 family multidrug resistance protein-like MFS transporter
VGGNVTQATHHWRRNQTAVTTATFMGFMSFTLVMPFLPLYFEQLGVQSTRSVAIWSGLSLGVTPAVTAAMAPVWARLAERYGRKMMVSRSLISFMVIMGALAFVRAPWQVFVLRAIQGFFAGYGPIALTMAAESAPPEQMATAIGWVQTAQRLGPALGPVIGGTLAHSVGLRGAFLVSAAVYLAAFLLVLVGYRESDIRKDVPAARPAKVTFADLRAVPHFLLFMGAVFGMQLADRSLGPILPLYLREIGVAPESVAFLAGILFTITAGSAAIGNLSSRWLLTQRSEGVLVAVMVGVASIAALVFAAGPAVGVLLGAAAGFGLALGVATTSIYTVASQSVTAERRGGAFAYLTSAYLMGLAVSPIVAGFIGSVSMRAVFLADAAGLALVAWLVKRGMVDAAR